MPKFLIAFTLLIVVCASSEPRQISIIGNILSKSRQFANKIRYLGSEIAHIKAPVAGNKVIVKFPQSPTNEAFIIHGIKTVHSSNSKVHILEGGLGKGQVTVAVTVPDNTDIDTEISVFGEIVKKQPGGVFEQARLAAKKEFEKLRQAQKQVEATTKESIIQQVQKFGPWNHA